MLKEAEHNQTIFSQVEPILDDQLPKKSLPKSKEVVTQEHKTPWFKQPRKVIIAVVLSLTFLMVTMWLLLAQNKTEPSVVLDQLPIPTKSPVATDLPAQIENTRQRLKRLDFQDSALVFPQIDRKIYINLVD